MWLKNSKGKPDAMLTCAVVSLAAVLLKFLAAGVSITWGTHTFTAGPLDAALVGAILVPTFTAYWARKHTDSKKSDDKPAA